MNQTEERETWVVSYGPALNLRNLVITNQKWFFEKHKNQKNVRIQFASTTIPECADNVEPIYVIGFM